MMERDLGEEEGPGAAVRFRGASPEKETLVADGGAEAQEAEGAGS